MSTNFAPAMTTISTKKMLHQNFLHFLMHFLVKSWCMFGSPQGYPKVYPQANVLQAGKQF
jgi:hypothetical protein